MVPIAFDDSPDDNSPDQAIGRLKTVIGAMPGMKVVTETSARTGRGWNRLGKHSGLHQLDVFGARTLRPIPFRIRDFLAFAQFLEAYALQGLRMEKQVFGATRADESKTPVRQFLDLAFGHLFVFLGESRPTWPVVCRIVPDTGPAR
jgi:hypothetical protein